MTTTADFSQPTPLTPAEVAFGAAGRCLDLMPRWEDIPDDFRRGHTEWNRTVRTWFYSGLSGWPCTPKPGIDHGVALGHLSAIQGSFEPKHEHKMAAVAYLMSLWYEPAKPGHKGGAKPKPRRPKVTEGARVMLPKKRNGELKGGLDG